MTIEELSELYYIKKEMKQIQKDLVELERKRFQKGEDLLEFKKALEQALHYNLCTLQKKRVVAEKFLGTIKDAETRLIIRLRVINHMKWKEIANELGLERTTVSKRFYKFFTEEENSHNSRSTCDRMEVH